MLSFESIPEDGGLSPYCECGWDDGYCACTVTQDCSLSTYSSVLIIANYKIVNIIIII